MSVALAETYQAGVAVTSHDVSHTATAHVEGLSLLPNGFDTTHVGATTHVGNAVLDSTAGGSVFTVEGKGGDIWGSADDFQFVQMPAQAGAHAALIYRVAGVDNVNALAKAGVMFRDGTNANAASVVLDAKPDGGVEFMARVCVGCATSYLGGAHVVFPAFLSLVRGGATFTASVFTADPGDGTTIGSVTVPMAAPIQGFAVTSHDTERVVTAVFDDPAR